MTMLGKVLLSKPIFITSAALGSFGVICLLKELTGGTRYKREPRHAEGKIVIVTGANTGIGKETAWELARRGVKVYMACRDMKRCETAREEIVLDTKNKYVYCRPCNLASLQSIRSFVKQFKTEEQRLDVLINNAGVMNTPNSKTRDGFEMHLGVNHMGHFLLTHLLLDALKTSAPSRIINVSCVAHKKGKINKGDLNSDKNYDADAAYAQSKLANVLFTKELAEKLKGTNITVNAVNPGTTDSDIMRHMSFYNSRTAKIFVKPIMWPFIKSPRQAAQTIIFMALDNNVTDVTGKYFSNYETTEFGETANDEASAKWLWAVSEKWTRCHTFQEIK